MKLEPSVTPGLIQDQQDSVQDPGCFNVAIFIPVKPLLQRDERGLFCINVC